MNSRTPLSIDDTQKIALRILDYLDSYCSQHGLRYFLVGGSLIGAVRDHDLVAWDDDVDVAMPRPDYERLLREFQDTDDLRLVHQSRTPECVYGMAKLVDTHTTYNERWIDSREYMGVFVDIFPLDSIPEGATRFMEWCGFLKKLYLFGFALSQRSAVGKPLKGFVLKLCRTVLRPFGRYGFFCRVEKVFRSKPGDWVFNGWGAWGKRESGPAAWFESTVPVAIRGRQYLAPAGYDEWLTKVYGDYMTPPANPAISHGDYFLKDQQTSRVENGEEKR